MGFTLYKTVQTFFFPYTLLLFALITSNFFIRKQKFAKLGTRLLAVTTVLLLLFSFPPLTNMAVTYLESKYPPRLYKDYPNADFIVVLGGSIAQQIGKPREVEETEGTRLIPAFQLYQLKKAPKIILAGGGSYQGFNGVERTESADMAELLIRLGVPKTDLILETKSRTTLENAEEVSKLLTAFHNPKVLLVTSAPHMYRAHKAFEKFNVAVIPVPTAHRSKFGSPFVWDYVPGAHALYYNSLLAKEILGRMAYSFIPQKSHD